MNISAITFFNIVIVAVTYEIPSYPVQTMGIFASTDNNGTSTAPQWEAQQTRIITHHIVNIIL